MFTQQVTNALFCVLYTAFCLGLDPLALNALFACAYAFLAWRGEV